MPLLVLLPAKKAVRSVGPFVARSLFEGRVNSHSSPVSVVNLRFSRGGVVLLLLLPRGEAAPDGEVECSILQRFRLLKATACRYGEGVFVRRRRQSPLGVF